MNRPLFSIACFTLLIAPALLQARDRGAAATPPKEVPTVPVVVPPYVLKNRSQFNGPGDLTRVPFWPVGWTKQKQNLIAMAAVAPEAKVTLDEKNFRISSILISSGTTPSLAVINGRAYGEGEFLRMPKGSSARIRVERINDGNVTLHYEDQRLVVPLRRTELNQHKTESDTLDPNR